MPQSREAIRANWARENARLAQAHHDYRHHRHHRHHRSHGRRRWGDATAFEVSILVLLVMFFLILNSLLNLF